MLFKFVDADLEVSEVVCVLFVFFVVDFIDVVSIVFIIVVFATIEPTVAISLFWNVASFIDVVGRFLCFDSTIELRVKQLILKQVIKMIRFISRYFQDTFKDRTIQ